MPPLRFHATSLLLLLLEPEEEVLALLFQAGFLLLEEPLLLLLHCLQFFTDVEVASGQLILQVGEPLVVVDLIEHESAFEDLVLILEVGELALQPSSKDKGLLLQGRVPFDLQLRNQLLQQYDGVDYLLGIASGIIQLFAANEEPCNVFWGRLLVVG